MPWDYKTNKPSAMKYLHPKIQRKAIAIANAMVETGSDDGIAIATGIKKAKHMVKLAAANIKEFLHANKFGLGGAALGLGVGALESEDIDGKPFSKGKRIANTLVGGVGFGLTGWGIDRMRGTVKDSFNQIATDIDDPRDVNAKIRSKLNAALKPEQVTKAKGGYHRFPLEAHARKDNYRLQLIHFNKGKDGVEKLAHLRDGSPVKKTLAILKSGNDKYLVENYKKLVEKLKKRKHDTE